MCTGTSTAASATSSHSAPLVLGHECAGRVAAVGRDVTKHAIGDRVCLEPGVPCGRCRECRAGRYNLCVDVAFFATPPVDGAFADFVTIHEDFAFALPAGMSDDVGALMEPLSVGIWACRKAHVTAGDRVLVTGAGPIGLLAMQVAKAFGATDVAVSDVNEHRLAAAERMGATRVLRAGLDAPGEVDALIECSGHPGALVAGIEALRPAGTAVVVGMGPKPTAEIPLSLIQNRELWLTGTFRYANTYPTAIELAATGRVDVAALITGHYDLDDTEAALLAGRDEREHQGHRASPHDRMRTVPAPTPEIVLRALAPTDAAELLALRRRNRRHFQPSEPLRDADWFTLASQRREIEAEERARASGSSLSFGVFADGALVGRVALTSIVRGAFCNAYLGYAIDQAHAGRGIGTATVRQAVAIAWAAGLHRVQAAVSPGNVASQRVLEKAGFRREGLAKHYLRLAGRWTDQELWAITTEDEDT